MIAIIDYGMGNIGSIANMLRKLGADCVVTSEPGVIAKAEKLILPGVGAFDAAMRRINESGLRAALDRTVTESGIPVLGICLGMQLLTDCSEEGVLPGLGWIPAKTLAFSGRIDRTLKVPHMGWNRVAQHTPSPLTEGLETVVEPRFYFVHSYFVKCEDEAHSILKTTYGFTYDSAIQKGNVFGVQFHPEKSHRFGMKLLQNFARI